MPAKITKIPRAPQKRGAPEGAPLPPPPAVEVEAAAPLYPRNPKTVLTSHREQAEFARRLHRALQDKRMTQSDLAAAVWGRQEAKVGDRTASVARNRERISVYLKGQGYPRPHVLRRMADVLGMAPEELAPEMAGPQVPPEVYFTLARATRDGRPCATLAVNTTIPADLALRIVQLIQEAHAQELLQENFDDDLDPEGTLDTQHHPIACPGHS